MRNHPLRVGEIVFDIDVCFFGVIVELTENKAVLDMNGKTIGLNVKSGWCENENRLMFDEELSEDELKWECDNLDNLYQVAWGVKDKRTENVVCYEHIEMYDDEHDIEYPYFSPYLNENLYHFEVDE